MVSPGTYVQQVVQELKKVTWPTGEQTRNMTLLVLFVSALAALYLGILDVIFQRLITWLFSR